MRPVERVGQGLKARNQVAHTDGEGNIRDMQPQPIAWRLPTTVEGLERCGAVLVGVALCCPSAPAPWSAEAYSLRGGRDL